MARRVANVYRSKAPTQKSHKSLKRKICAIFATVISVLLFFGNVYEDGYDMEVQTTKVKPDGNLDMDNRGMNENGSAAAGASSFTGGSNNENNLSGSGAWDQSTIHSNTNINTDAHESELQPIDDDNNINSAGSEDGLDNEENPDVGDDEENPAVGSEDGLDNAEDPDVVDDPHLYVSKTSAPSVSPGEEDNDDRSETQDNEVSKKMDDGYYDKLNKFMGLNSTESDSSTETGTGTGTNATLAFNNTANNSGGYTFNSTMSSDDDTNAALVNKTSTDDDTSNSTMASGQDTDDNMLADVNATTLANNTSADYIYNSTMKSTQNASLSFINMNTTSTNETGADVDTYNSTMASGQYDEDGVLVDMNVTSANKTNADEDTYNSTMTSSQNTNDDMLADVNATSANETSADEDGDEPLADMNSTSVNETSADEDGDESLADMNSTLVNETSADMDIYNSTMISGNISAADDDDGILVDLNSTSANVTSVDVETYNSTMTTGNGTADDDYYGNGTIIDEDATTSTNETSVLLETNNSTETMGSNHSHFNILAGFNAVFGNKENNVTSTDDEDEDAQPPPVPLEICESNPFKSSLNASLEEISAALTRFMEEVNSNVTTTVGNSKGGEEDKEEAEFAGAPKDMELQARRMLRGLEESQVNSDSKEKNEINDGGLTETKDEDVSLQNSTSFAICKEPDSSELLPGVCGGSVHSVETEGSEKEDCEYFVAFAGTVPDDLFSMPVHIKLVKETVCKVNVVSLCTDDSTAKLYYEKLMGDRELEEKEKERLVVHEGVCITSQGTEAKLQDDDDTENTIVAKPKPALVDLLYIDMTGSKYLPADFLESIEGERLRLVNVADEGAKEENIYLPKQIVFFGVGEEDETLLDDRLRMELLRKGYVAISGVGSLSYIRYLCPKPAPVIGTAGSGKLVASGFPM